MSGRTQEQADGQVRTYAPVEGRSNKAEDFLRYSALEERRINLQRRRRELAQREVGGSGLHSASGGQSRPVSHRAGGVRGRKATLTQT